MIINIKVSIYILIHFSLSMSMVQNEQLLTRTDISILKLLVNSRGPVKMGEIVEHIGKYHQRVKDRVKRLEGAFIMKSNKKHSNREKPYEIIPSEKAFVKSLIIKFK